MVAVSGPTNPSTDLIYSGAFFLCVCVWPVKIQEALLVKIVSVIECTTFLSNDYYISRFSSRPKHNMSKSYKVATCHSLF